MYDRPPIASTSLTPCDALIDAATDYIENFLGAADAVLLEIHLAGCADCRTYLTQMRAAIDALADLRRGTIPDDVRDSLREPFGHVPRSAPGF